MRVAFEKEGYKSPGYLKAQTKILDELLGIRFTAKMVEKLCDTLRDQVDEVRSLEKQIYEIVVNKCGMPRPHFIKVFPGNETNLRWADARSRCRPAVQRGAEAQPAGRQGTAGQADRPAGARRAAAAATCARSTSRWPPARRRRARPSAK